MDPEIIEEFMVALARAAWQRPDMTEEEAIRSVEIDFHINNTDIARALANSGMKLVMAAGGS